MHGMPTASLNLNGDEARRWFTRAQSKALECVQAMSNSVIDRIDHELSSSTMVRSGMSAYATILRSYERLAKRDRAAAIVNWRRRSLIWPLGCTSSHHPGTPNC